MIKAKKGTVKLKGDNITLLVEFTNIVRALNDIYEKKEGPERAKEMLETGFKTGFMTDEEIEEEVRKKAHELLKEVVNSMEP